MSEEKVKRTERERLSPEAYRHKLDYTKNYDSTHKRGIYMKLHQNNDADIIEKLDSLENKQGYIKELIRADIAKEQKKAKKQKE